MPRVEMLAAYFVHDDEGWRIKGHARRPMFRWMATWAVALRRPSDIGGDDTGYILPGLDITSHLLPVDGRAGRPAVRDRPRRGRRPGEGPQGHTRGALREGCGTDRGRAG